MTRQPSSELFGPITFTVRIDGKQSMDAVARLNYEIGEAIKRFMREPTGGEEGPWWSVEMSWGDR